MKTQSIRMCALIVLMIQTFALAQKTEVTVRKGKVVAEMASQSVEVGAGRKAILSDERGLSTTVDDPMVDDLMKIHKWVEAEKQAQREQIDETSIQIIRVDSETRFTLAYYLEVPNTKSEPRSAFWVNGVSLLDEPRFYDLQGRLLSFHLDKTSANRANYLIRFSEPVAPGEKFRYLCVSKLDGSLWQHGPLWHLQAGWGATNCLNYFRFILPESAIFVDSNRPVAVTDTVEGNVAVTIRNFTGLVGDGLFHIAFLWPDRDGTTLADLPPKYRGLPDSEQEDIVREGQLGMARILAGEVIDDQSTPLTTVGTLCSAVVRRDKQRVIDLMANSFLKGIAALQYDQFIHEQGTKMVEAFGLLSTPTWPEAPANGYEHPVHLTRKGSLLHDATIMTVYRDGKWYWGGLNYAGPATGSTVHKKEAPADDRSVTLSKEPAGLEVATYTDPVPGQFLRDWLFLGLVQIPWEGEGYFPDEKAANAFFDAKALDVMRFAPKVTILENDFEWTHLHSEYGVVDLTKVYDDWFVIAYAWAQIEMSEETDAVLGIGCDDRLSVWLNGALVRPNIKGGPVGVDKDRVPVTFKKGKNQLVLKIMNYGGPWGFACRLLDE